MRDIIKFIIAVSVSIALWATIAFWLVYIFVKPAIDDVAYMRGEFQKYSFKCEQ